MGNCKFLRQKKQVKINGEWVDTRSYRYLPYCDGGTPGVRVRGSNPNGKVIVYLSSEVNGVLSYMGHTIQLDANGNGYLALESNDIVAYVIIRNSMPPRGIAEISGCYASIQGYPKYSMEPLNDIDELIVDCARYRRLGKGYLSQSNFEGKKITIKSLDTSNETDTSHMFTNCYSATSIDVSGLNTSNATDMGAMFGNCHSVTSLDVSHFNTSNVTNMGGMFENCESLSFLDVSHFNTSNVTDMGFMFESCQSLSSLDVSHFNTSNVTTMRAMFHDCRNLTSLDVSHFNTSNVTTMRAMFRLCLSLQSLDLSNFDTSNVTNMAQMFSDCTNLISLDLSGWDTSNVTNMSYMFYSCSSLSTIYMRNCSQTTIDKIKKALSDSDTQHQVTIIT